MAYSRAMVDTDKAAKERIDELDRLRRETEAILAASRALIAELQDKLEELRQQRAVHEALLEQRERQKKS